MYAGAPAGRLSLAFSWAGPATLSLGGAVLGLVTFTDGLTALILGPAFRAHSVIQIRNVGARSVVRHSDAATFILVGLALLWGGAVPPQELAPRYAPPRLTDLSVAS